MGGVVGYNSERGPSKDHFTIVWAHLTQQFQKRSFLNDFLPNSSLKLLGQLGPNYGGMVFR
jgi:hypothetical protein